MSNVNVRVKQEIEDLHAFFCEWFGGNIPETHFERYFSARFARDLVFIPPAGRSLGLADLTQSIYKGYASNSDFRVQIRNVVVRHTFSDHVLATYEEWQRNALASTPADNGRIATVLFELGDQLIWHHIHETWLPLSVMEKGPYNF